MTQAEITRSDFLKRSAGVVLALALPASTAKAISRPDAVPALLSPGEYVLPPAFFVKFRDCYGDWTTGHPLARATLNGEDIPQTTHVATRTESIDGARLFREDGDLLVEYEFENISLANGDCLSVSFPVVL